MYIVFNIVSWFIKFNSCELRSQICVCLYRKVHLFFSCAWHFFSCWLLSGSIQFSFFDSGCPWPVACYPSYSVLLIIVCLMVLSNGSEATNNWHWCARWEEKETWFLITTIASTAMKPSASPWSASITSSAAWYHQNHRPTSI